MALVRNRRYTIRISPFVKSEDGDLLNVALEYFFTTRYAPLYCSTTVIRSRIGPFIFDIPDDTINFVIHEISKNVLVQWPGLGAKYGVTNGVLNEVPKAVQGYVCCATRYQLLVTVLLEGSRGLGSKMLGDFRIDKGFGAKTTIDRSNPAIAQAQECMDYWDTKIEELLVGPLTPKVVVKGCNVDEPPTNRNWKFQGRNTSLGRRGTQW